MKMPALQLNSVAGRLTGGFAFLLVLLVAVAALGAVELTRANQRVTQIVQVHNHRSELAHELLEAINRLSVQTRTIALLTEVPSIQAEVKAIAQSVKTYNAAQARLQETLSADAEAAAELKLLAEIAALAQKAVPQLETAAKQGASGDNVSAGLTVTQQAMPTETAWRNKVGEFVKLQTEATAAAAATAQAARQRSFLLGATLVLLALGIGAWVAWRITRSIQRPIAQTLTVAERIADGDLSTEVVVQGHDELGRLLQAVATMQTRLRTLVGEIRHTADSIQVASTEVASGNTDLSQRTEQAASSLQKTASSMEQLTGTVQHSAQSAVQANQLAASASQVATRGGEVVAQVVSTMDAIHASSKKISDIIGTIDGIAFQTNILALNAAVEAARAGEQGRGFAVVASEVRGLAQRSAEAAREIKSLIGASVEKVESGSRLVGDAGTTMNEIVASVKRVGDIIGEITHATGEQSSGIGQVNEAVTQLDQMTQQNAALVEQSAAAAESLKDQAARLAQVVGAFRLERA
jgi:methyl-accepting chemotaxis protein